jgi:hypothetical protein
MAQARTTFIFLLILFLGLPAALVAIAFAWLGFLSAADSFKLGWVEVPVHYRLSFGVEVNGVSYTGSTVVQVTYQQIPSWQVINGPGIATLYEGQAAYVKLPDGKAIFLLPTYLTPKFGGKRVYDVRSLPDYLLSVNGSPSGPTKKWTPIGVRSATTVTGSSDIPDNFLPLMIIFENWADASTAHFFQPEHPQQTLGDQSRFLGAQIAVTKEPVSRDIETVFPWLEAEHSFALGNPGDSFRQENRGNGLYKADFFTRPCVFLATYPKSGIRTCRQASSG